MIEVQGLTKSYPTQTAVSDVTFSVKEGEIVGFLGPNGAGKTTTMRVLTGFLPPTSGTARIAGHDVVAQSRQARASLGYLPESAALYPELRVREYLAYRARLEGISGSEVRSRVDQAVERCLLADVADRKIDNLSKGYRQRTALAGALVHQPPVLILDEPTVGLDPMQIIKIREMIRTLGRERAVLLSTHILPEVDAVCDRVLIIDRGRIVAEGAPNELRARLAGKPVVRVAFRGAVPAREALEGIPGCPLGRGRRRRDGDAGPRRVRARRRSPGSDLREGRRTRPRSAGARVRRGLARRRLRAPDPARRARRLRSGARNGRAAGGAPRRRERLVRRLLAIVGREWRAYFLSPLAYVILAAFLLMNGLIFWAIVAFMNTPGAPKGQALPYLFTNTYFWIFNLFVVPIIAMRLFPEERKSGTIETLLTSPVSEAMVVGGKFIGALGFFLTLWAPTLVYVLIIRSNTSVDLGPVASSYLAVLLLGGFFLSVGTFASTLSKNQIVAAILAFGMLIPIFSAGLLESLGADPSKREIFGYLNLWDHMDDFARGIVDTRHVVYAWLARRSFSSWRPCRSPPRRRRRERRARGVARRRFAAIGPASSFLGASPARHRHWARGD
jgi:ABC-2 type transport system ATP-binding protein